MTQNSAADIIVVLDESGSMESMGPEPVQALNQFVKNQQKTDSTSLFSLYAFNHDVRNIYSVLPLGGIKEYSDYRPNGTTALYDCVFTAISDKMKTSRTKNVVLVIVTDGLDNSSAHSKDEVRAKIKEQEEKHNWQV